MFPAAPPPWDSQHAGFPVMVGRFTHASSSARNTSGWIAWNVLLTIGVIAALAVIFWALGRTYRNANCSQCGLYNDGQGNIALGNDVLGVTTKSTLPRGGGGGGGAEDRRRNRRREEGAVRKRDGGGRSSTRDALSLRAVDQSGAQCTDRLYLTHNTSVSCDMQVLGNATFLSNVYVDGVLSATPSSTLSEEVCTACNISGVVNASAICGSPQCIVNSTHIEFETSTVNSICASCNVTGSAAAICASASCLVNATRVVGGPLVVSEATVQNTLTTQDLVVTDQANVSTAMITLLAVDALAVTGGADFALSVTMQQNLTVQQDLLVQGDLRVLGDATQLQITMQNITITDLVEVAEDVTIGGALNVTDNMMVYGDGLFGQDLSVLGNINVGGSVNFTDVTAQTVTADQFIGTLANLTTVQASTVNADSIVVTTITGSSFYGGFIQVGEVDTNLTSTVELMVSGPATLSSAVVSGLLDVVAGLVVNGTSVFKDTASGTTFSASTLFSGGDFSGNAANFSSLAVAGNASIAGTLTAGAFSASTLSASLFSGGDFVGAAGNFSSLHVSGNGTIDGVAQRGSVLGQHR